MATRTFVPGRVWAAEEIVEDCAEAQRLFRLRRINEPLEDYLAEYTASKAASDEVTRQLEHILASPPDQEFLASLCANPTFFVALRYLAAPPISEDDLDTLLSRSVSPSALRSDIGFARSLVDLLRQTIDPKRFPWVSEGRTPTEDELQTATVASAVAATIQRVQTKRRNDEKRDLEGAVGHLLLALGYRRINTPREAIHALEDLPGPQQYMESLTLGEDNADFVIGLGDRRRLALECKSSNSEINSRKRLNKEVVKDAEKWRQQFGNQVVAAAALRGVFNPRYVYEAQSAPLLIFWGHRLEDLAEFIQASG